MENIHEKIADVVDWQAVIGQMNEKGYALVSRFLPSQSCDALISNYNSSNLYRKMITMERHRFGLGEYKYFRYSLPDLIQTIRIGIYPKLAPIANAWMNMLNMERRFPDTLDNLQKLCHDHNQTKPTVIILKYG